MMRSAVALAVLFVLFASPVVGGELTPYDWTHDPRVELSFSVPIDGDYGSGGDSTLSVDNDDETFWRGYAHRDNSCDGNQNGRHASAAPQIVVTFPWVVQLTQVSDIVRGQVDTTTHDAHGADIWHRIQVRTNPGAEWETVAFQTAGNSFSKEVRTFDFPSIPTRQVKFEIRADGYGNCDDDNHGVADVYAEFYELSLVAAMPVTLPGDANFDDAVNLYDVIAISQRFGEPTLPWADGDATGDGRVDLDDMRFVADHFGTTSIAKAAAVPEPGAGLLALVALPLLLAFGRKDRRAHMHAECAFANDGSRVRNARRDC